MLAPYVEDIEITKSDIDQIVGWLEGNGISPLKCVIGERIPRVTGFNFVGEGDTTLPGHRYTAPDGTKWERNSFRDVEAEPHLKWWKRLDCHCGCR